MLDQNLDRIYLTPSHVGDVEREFVHEGFDTRLDSTSGASVEFCAGESCEGACVGVAFAVRLSGARSFPLARRSLLPRLSEGVRLVPMPNGMGWAQTGGILYSRRATVSENCALQASRTGQTTTNPSVHHVGVTTPLRVGHHMRPTSSMYARRRWS